MIRTSLLVPVSACLALTACGGMHPSGSMSAPMPVADAIKVPDGHKLAMQTVGVGELRYECRPKANAADQFEWAFVGPTATLNDRSGKAVGKYYGPPATWEAMDGSKVTATQVAVAPGGDGNIPHQLVKANPASPAMGSGMMSGVTFIQRVATRGGVAPAAACSAANRGAAQMVRYQADYLFWKAAA